MTREAVSTKASRRGGRERLAAFLAAGDLAPLIQQEAPDPRFAERRRDRFFAEAEA